MANLNSSLRKQGRRAAGSYGRPGSKRQKRAASKAARRALRLRPLRGPSHIDQRCEASKEALWEGRMAIRRERWQAVLAERRAAA